MAAEQTETKCCGTCGLWKPFKTEPVGDCMWEGPLPASISEFDFRVMSPKYGTTCPTWELKKESQK